MHQLRLLATRIARAAAVLAVAGATTASAAPFAFSNGSVDGRIATASRPDSTGKIEIETADVGGTTFNAAFTLSGVTIAAVPEPGAVALLALVVQRRRRA